MDVSVPVPLSRLLHLYASRSYNELDKLLDENSGDELQKNSLMRKLSMLYVLGVKLRMTIQFNEKFPNSKELFEYLHNSSYYAQYLNSFANILFYLHADIQRNLTSMYDVPGAIDLILGDCKSRLPMAIFPKKPSFENDPKPFLRLTSNSLKTKLLTVRLPNAFNVKFRSGRVALTLKNRYRLVLSINKRDGPFVCSELDFLLPDFYTLESESEFDLRRIYGMGVNLNFKTIIFPSMVKRIVKKINLIFEENDDAFMKIDELLSSVILGFQFQRIVNEGKRIEGLRLKTAQSKDPRKIRYSLWNSLLEIFLSKNAIFCSFEGHNIGDVTNKRFTDIVGECKRRAAISRLSYLQTELNGTIHEGSVPFLRVSNVDIYLRSFDGKLYVNDNSELTNLLNSRLYRRFLREVSKNNSQK